VSAKWPNDDQSSETAEGLRSVAWLLRGGSAGSSSRDTRSRPGAVLCSAIVRRLFGLDSL
jgi:hypothetical protein